MKIYIMLLLSLFLCSCATQSIKKDNLIVTNSKENPSKPEKETQRFKSINKNKIIAVADFNGKNVSSADASIISDFVRTNFVKKGFKIVEREDMDKILAETAFQQTGCTNAECAVKLGKILNADQIVIGSLSKLEKTYFISIYLIDVQSSEILRSEDIQSEYVAKLKTYCTILVEKLIYDGFSPTKYLMNE